MNPQALRRLANNLQRARRDFDVEAFVRDCVRGLEPLELKQRVQHVIEVLHRHLPQRFSEASRLLCAAATTWDRGDAKDPLSGFAAWPVIDYVAVHGLDDFETGMETLRCLTELFTAEFAIRPFIDAQPEAAIAMLRDWSSDAKPAVRRLCSEGLRPLLPWGKRVRYLTDHPEVIVSVLDALVYDDSQDVRRSVANNLNDLSKSHSDLVVRTCSRWLRDAPPERLAATNRLVRHATRTLVKSGHAEALSLHGVRGRAKLDAIEWQVSPKRIRLGDSLELTARLRSKAKTSQKLVIDYVVHHRKANQGTKPKVFKWKVALLGPGQALELRKRHSVRAITTRKYHAGGHVVELFVNGAVVASATFMLTMPNAATTTS